MTKREILEDLIDLISDNNLAGKNNDAQTVTIFFIDCLQDLLDCIKRIK